VKQITDVALIPLYIHGYAHSWKHLHDCKQT